jgi:hypothetical protein
MCGSSLCVFPPNFLCLMIPLNLLCPMTRVSSICVKNIHVLPLISPLPCTQQQLMTMAPLHATLLPSYWQQITTNTSSSHEWRMTIRSDTKSRKQRTHRMHNTREGTCIKHHDEQTKHVIFSIRYYLYLYILRWVR